MCTDCSFLEKRSFREEGCTNMNMLPRREQVGSKTMKTHQRLWAAALVASLPALIVAGLLQAQPTGQPHPQSVPESAAVHGTVVVQTRPAAATNVKQGSNDILMPAIEVYLHNMDTNADGPPEHSDMMGRFEFKPIKNGRYELRWKAQRGWAAGTFPTPVIIRGHVFYADPVTLQPEAGKGVITGSVQLADGTTPWFYSEE